MKHLLTLPEILCELDSVMAPPHGQSDNMSSNRHITTMANCIRDKSLQFTGPQLFNYCFFPSPKPVVTELDVERLAAVAVQELGVHSQAHLLVVDLRGQTKNQFPFLLMCHESPACEFTSVT